MYLPIPRLPKGEEPRPDSVEEESGENALILPAQPNQEPVPEEHVLRAVLVVQVAGVYSYLGLCAADLAPDRPRGLLLLGRP